MAQMKIAQPIPGVGYRGLALDGPARGLHLESTVTTVSCSTALWLAGGYLDIDMATQVETYHWQSWFGVPTVDKLGAVYFGFWSLKRECTPGELLEKLCHGVMEARKLLIRLNKAGLDKDL